ncbi:MAG: hypothetical protein WC852_00735 [Candidatus Nanoarchaeia archaeon]|jgi:hypothetical protein
MENLYRAHIAVRGDADHRNLETYLNYPDINGMHRTFRYDFYCIVKAGSEKEAKKKCRDNRKLQFYYKTCFYSYKVADVTELEEGKDLPLEQRVEMLKKKFMVLEE